MTTPNVPVLEAVPPRPARSARSPLRTALVHVAKRPSVVIAAAWLLLVVLATAAAPIIAPHDPMVQSLQNAFALPDGAHPLGADSLGRDVLSRLLYGGSGVLLGALETTVIGLAIGLPVGLVAGYIGGWLDSVIGFVVNVLFSIPGFVVVLVIAFVTRNQTFLIMAGLGVVYSGAISRLARASTISARDLLYVDAARVSGLTRGKLIFRHVLPNISGPILVQAFLLFSGAFVILTSLSFLGLGFSPLTPAWGQMVFEATQNISTHPWLMVPVGAVLIFTVLALNHLGSSIRDALPQAQRQSLLAPRRRLRAPGQLLNVRRAEREPAERPVAVPVPVADDRPLPVERPVAIERPVADEEIVLDVQHLTVSFPTVGGENAIVDDVSFSLRKGEVLGLVGESGCGKTMTALALIGLVPNPGIARYERLSVAGALVDQDQPRQWENLRGSKVALVGQEPMVALDPCFTVEATLRQAMRTHRRMSRSDATREAIAILTKVGIPDAKEVARRFPHQLSGGMAQRVAIALALCGEPDVLIADEPTTALDVTVQAEIVDLLLQIREQLGTTIVLVSHDLGVVADMCDRVAVMYAGQVIEIGDTATVLDDPRHPYTRGLIAASPEIGGARTELTTIPGRVPVPAEWPVGCRFASRCPLRTPECTAGPIPLELVSTIPARQLARCVHSGEVSDMPLEEAS